MKKNGFTLVEVLVSIVISGMLVTAMAGMLIYGHKTFENMYNSKNRLQDYMFFKTRLDNHLNRMVGPGFRLIGGTVPDTEIKFDNWAGGSWSGKVHYGVVFYAVDNTMIIKGAYTFDRNAGTIRYRQWNNVNQVNALPNLDESGTAAIDEIILSNVRFFQVTNSLNGIQAWDEIVNDKGDLVSNLYLRVYIELERDVYREGEVTYSFTEDYINHNVARNLKNKNKQESTTSDGKSDVIKEL